MFIGEKAISSTIFTLDDFKHIFRAFLAAAFQPEFYDVGNARFEKLHVIFNKSVSEMYAGKGSIIADDFIIVVISQLKIGIIKDLIIFYVPEQFQIVIAVEALRDFLFVQAGYFVLQFIPYLSLIHI